MKKVFLIFLALVILAMPMFSLNAADTNGDGISDDIKEFYDAYEAFVDTNIEIIKKYEDGDKSLSDTEEIKDWLEYSTKSLNLYNKTLALNSNDFTEGDVSYIAEVHLRILKKVADYSVSATTSSGGNSATTATDTSKSTATSGAPQTFDAGIVIAVSAMAVSAGAVFSLKRRK